MAWISTHHCLGVGHVRWGQQRLYHKLVFAFLIRIIIERLQHHCTNKQTHNSFSIFQTFIGKTVKREQEKEPVWEMFWARFAPVLPTLTPNTRPRLQHHFWIVRNKNTVKLHSISISMRQRHLNSSNVIQYLGVEHYSETKIFSYSLHIIPLQTLLIKLNWPQKGNFSYSS